jgi:hypothetical protein
VSQPPGSGPYPPQGPAPQQQPPYGSQPPYGQPPQSPYGQPQQSPYGQPPQSPYRPPQQPGYGQQPPPFTPPQGGGPRPAPSGQEPFGFAQQPSNFAAQQPYRAPGQAGPSPYGPGAPGWTSPGGVPPQLPKKKSRAGLVVGVVAIVLVLIVAGGVAMFMNQAKNAVVTAASNITKAPTATTTTAGTKATTGTTTKTTTAVGGTDVSCSGSTIDSGVYSATVPSGWQCTSQSGGLMISDKKYDTLLVMDIEQTTDAAAVCGSLATSGSMTPLADTQWGGKAAKTAEMDSAGTKVHVRCVNVNDSVFYLMAVPITGTYDEVVAGVNALTSGWTWK